MYSSVSTIQWRLSTRVRYNLIRVFFQFSFFRETFCAKRPVETTMAKRTIHFSSDNVDVKLLCHRHRLHSVIIATEGRRNTEKEEEEEKRQQQKMKIGKGDDDDDITIETSRGHHCRRTIFIKNSRNSSASEQFTFNQTFEVSVKIQKSTL